MYERRKEGPEVLSYTIRVAHPASAEWPTRTKGSGVVTFPMARWWILLSHMASSQNWQPAGVTMRRMPYCIPEVGREYFSLCNKYYNSTKGDSDVATIN
jgi:hypothetical protein